MDQERMKSKSLIIWIISFLKFSTFILAQTQICQHLVINKTNKCKQKFYPENRKKLSICMCRDMNVKILFSTLQTLVNLKDLQLSFDIFFKNKKPVILGENLNIKSSIQKHLVLSYF